MEAEREKGEMMPVSQFYEVKERLKLGLILVVKDCLGF